MGLSNEENERRKNDANVKYLVDKICNKDGDAPYVFISYKSDDWEIVLQDIVYRLVKEEGLNVYFDGDFGSHNQHWTTQFPLNMSDPKCKGVLVFLDDKYATSYATLLELMYSQCSCQNPDTYEFEKKNVVPVNLVKALSVIEDVTDTGLGKKEYYDGEKKVKNIKAYDEKKLFDKAFQRGCKKMNIFDKSEGPYTGKGELSKKLCSLMVEELLSSIDYNDNFYLKKGESLTDIVNSIKSVCGEEVSVKNMSKGEDRECLVNENASTVITINSEETLIKPNVFVQDGYKSARLDKVAIPTSPIEGYSYTIFGKEYQAGKREQGKLMYDAYSALVGKYPEKAEELTARTSIARVESVTNANTQDAKPPYFRTCQKFTVANGEYYVGTSYGFEAKIAEIKGMFKICGEDASEFILNGEPLVGKTHVTVKTYDNCNDREEGNTDCFEYKLWNNTYTANKLSDMMHNVFDMIAQKYPEKIDGIAHDESITSVALKIDVDGGRLPVNKLNYFMAKKEHEVDGVIYYVSTRYNREQGIVQLERMISYCEGTSDSFQIVSAPDKSTHSSNGKKGIGELL